MFASPLGNGKFSAYGYVHNFSDAHGVLLFEGQTHDTEEAALKAGVAYAKAEIEKVRRK
jgi:hypothetical protein